MNHGATDEYIGMNWPGRDGAGAPSPCGFGPPTTTIVFLWQSLYFQHGSNLQLCTISKGERIIHDARATHTRRALGFAMKWTGKVGRHVADYVRDAIIITLESLHQINEEKEEKKQGYQNRPCKASRSC